jgi:hypothetical protein
VYVFKRTSGVWQQEAYVKASNTASLDSFGWGLALSGDYLAVGAPGEDSAGPGENNAVPVTNEANQNDNSVEIAGAIYVFQRSGATWSQLDYLKAPIVGVRDGLGGSMALGTLPGGTLSVVSGAIGEDSDPAKPSSDNSMVDSGAVYVYLHN